MSYILDALRKADAQRERDRLPGLRAQHLNPGEPLEPTSRRWPWVAACLALGAVLLVLGVRTLEDDAVQTALPTPSAQPTWVTPSAPSAPSAPSTLPSSPAIQAAPADVEVTPATAAEPVALPAPAPAAQVMPPAPPPAPSPAPASPPAAVARTAPSPAPSPAASVATAREPSAEPPPGAPRLVVTGGVYSTDPAQRMLIVNGQVFNEGGEPAPGVKIEGIRPAGAVLNYQGQRYSVKY